MDKESGYNKEHRPLARKLRVTQTLGETILWTRILSKKQLKGWVFNRQYCIGEYIVDFICRELKLIIEVDGCSHDFKISEDEYRDAILESNGYTILRILEKDVRNNLDGVYLEILRVLDELTK